jgi:hypothetical protein
MEVSKGTLRLQDLIPTFHAVLREIAYEISEEEYASEWPPEDDDWWDSEDATWVFERLFDDLNFWAPDGHYFGVHPGDGSLFGFWEVTDED